MGLSLVCFACWLLNSPLLGFTLSLARLAPSKWMCALLYQVITDSSLLCLLLIGWRWRNEGGHFPFCLCTLWRICFCVVFAPAALCASLRSLCATHFYVFVLDSLRSHLSLISDRSWHPCHCAIDLWSRMPFCF